MNETRSETSLSAAPLPGPGYNQGHPNVLLWDPLRPVATLVRGLPVLLTAECPLQDSNLRTRLRERCSSNTDRTLIRRINSVRALERRAWARTGGAAATRVVQRR
jgi:hypothetical protein